MIETFAQHRFFQTPVEDLDESVRVAAAELVRAVVDAQVHSGKTIGQFADAIGWSRATLEAVRYGKGGRRIGLRLMASLAAADPQIVDAELREAALRAVYLEVLRRAYVRGGLDPFTYATIRRAEQRA